MVNTPLKVRCEKEELNHPSDVAVDKDGDVYVAEWGNHRVVVYQPDGTLLAISNGDAVNLSAWAKAGLEASPALGRVELYHEHGLGVLVVVIMAGIRSRELSIRQV